jgi:hypothetical protein
MLLYSQVLFGSSSVRNCAVLTHVAFCTVVNMALQCLPIMLGHSKGGQGLKQSVVLKRRRMWLLDTSHLG